MFLGRERMSICPDQATSHPLLRDLTMPMAGMLMITLLSTSSGILWLPGPHPLLNQREDCSPPDLAGEVKGTRAAMEDPVPGSSITIDHPIRDTRMHTEMAKEPCPGSLNWAEETADHLPPWLGAEASKMSAPGDTPAAVTWSAIRNNITTLYNAHRNINNLSGRDRELWLQLICVASTWINRSLNIRMIENTLMDSTVYVLITH